MPIPDNLSNYEPWLQSFDSADTQQAANNYANDQAHAEADLNVFAYPGSNDAGVTNLLSLSPADMQSFLTQNGGISHILNNFEFEMQEPQIFYQVGENSTFARDMQNSFNAYTNYPSEQAIYNAAGVSNSTLFQTNFLAFLESQSTSVNSNSPKTLDQLFQNWAQFSVVTATLTNNASGLPSYENVYQSYFGSTAGFASFAANFINQSISQYGYFNASQFYASFQSAVQTEPSVFSTIDDAYSAFLTANPNGSSSSVQSQLNSLIATWGSGTTISTTNSQGPAAFFDSLFEAGGTGSYLNTQNDTAINSVFSTLLSALNLNVSQEGSFLDPSGNTETYLNQVFQGFLAKEQSETPSQTTLGGFFQDFINFINPTAVVTNAAATGSLSGVQTYQAYYDNAYGFDTGFTAYVTNFINSQIQANGYFVPGQSFTAFQNEVNASSGDMSSVVTNAWQSYLTATGTSYQSNFLDQSFAQIQYMPLTNTNNTSQTLNGFDGFGDFFLSLVDQQQSASSDSLFPVSAVENAYLTNFTSTLNPDLSTLASLTGLSSTQIMNQTLGQFLLKIQQGQQSLPSSLAGFQQEWINFITPTAVLTTADATGALSGLPSYQTYYDNAFGTNTGFTSFLTDFINNETSANGYFLPSQFYTAFQNSVNVLVPEGGSSAYLQVESAFQGYITSGTLSTLSGQTAYETLDTLINNLGYLSGNQWSTLLADLDLTPSAQITSGQAIAYVFDSLFGVATSPTAPQQSGITSTFLTNFENALNLNPSNPDSGYLVPAATGVAGGTNSNYLDSIVVGFIKNLAASSNPPTSLASFITDWNNFITPTAVLTNAGATGSLSGLPSYQAYYDSLFRTDVGFTAYLTNFISTQTATNGYFLPSQSYIAFQSAVNVSTENIVANLSNYNSFVQSLNSTQAQEVQNADQTYDPTIEAAFNSEYYYIGGNSAVPNFNGTYGADTVAQIFSTVTTPSQMALLMQSPTNGFNVVQNFVYNYLYDGGLIVSNPSTISTLFLNEVTQNFGLNDPAESSILSAAGVSANSLLQSNFLAFLESQTSSVNPNPPPTSLPQLLLNWQQFSLVTATLTNNANGNGLPSYQGFFNEYFPSGVTSTGEGFASYVENFIQQSITQYGYFNPSQFYNSFQTVVFNSAEASGPQSVTAAIQYAYVNYLSDSGSSKSLSTMFSQLDSSVTSWGSGTTSAPNNEGPAAFFDSLFVGGNGSFNAGANSTINTQFIDSISSALIPSGATQEGSLLSGVLNENTLNSVFESFLAQEQTSATPPTSLAVLLQDWNTFITPTTVLTNAAATGTLSGAQTYQAYYDSVIGSTAPPGFTAFVAQFINSEYQKNGYFLPSQFYGEFQAAVVEQEATLVPPPTVTPAIQDAYIAYSSPSGVPSESLANLLIQLDSSMAAWYSGTPSTTNNAGPSAFFDSLFAGNSSYINAGFDSDISNAFIANIASALNLTGEEQTLLTSNTAYLNQIFGAFLAQEQGKSNPPATLAGFLQDFSTYITPSAVLTTAAATGALISLPTYQAVYDSAYPTNVGGFISYVTAFINSQTALNGYFLPSQFYTTFQNEVSATSGQGVNTAITNYWTSYNAYYGSSLPISNLGGYISAINSNPFGNNQGSGFINAFQGPGFFFDSLINIGNPGAQASFEANVTSGNGLFEEQAVNSAFQSSFNTLLNLDIPAENSLLSTIPSSSMNNLFGHFIEGLIGHAPSTTTAFLQDWINYITPTAVLTTSAGAASGLPSYQTYYDQTFGTVGFTSFLTNFANAQIAQYGYFLPSKSYAAFQNQVNTLAQGGGYSESQTVQGVFQDYVTAHTVGTNSGQTADQTLDTLINGNQWNTLLAALDSASSTQIPSGQALAYVFDTFFQATPNNTMNFIGSSITQSATQLTITSAFLTNLENTLNINTPENTQELNYLVPAATGQTNGTLDNYFDTLVVAFIKQLANGTLPTPNSLDSFIEDWNTFIGTPTGSPVIATTTGSPSYQAYYFAEFGTNAGFTAFLNNFISAQVVANGYFIPSQSYAAFQIAAGAASGTTLESTIQSAFVDYSQTFGTPQPPNTALDSYISQQFSNSSVFATLSTNKGPSSFFISLFNQGLLGPNGGGSSVTEPSIDTALLANFSYLFNLNTPAESSLLLGSGSATQDMNKVFAAFLSGESSSHPATLAALLQDWKNFITTPTPAVITNAAATGAFIGVPSYQAYYDNLFGTDAGFTAYVTQFINSQTLANGGYFVPGQSYDTFQTDVLASTGLGTIVNAFINFENSKNPPISYNLTTALPAINTIIAGLPSNFSYNTNNGPAEFFDSLFGGDGTPGDPNVNASYLTIFSSLLSLNITDESTYLTGATTPSTTVPQVMDQAFAAFVTSIESSPSKPQTLGAFQLAWFNFITPTAVLSTAAGTASGLPSYQQYYDDNLVGAEGFTAYLNTFINNNSPNGYFSPSQSYNAFIASTGSFPAIVTAFNSYNPTVPLSTLNTQIASINYATLNTSNSPAAFFDSLFVGAGGTASSSSTANDSAIASDFLANITNALNLNISPEGSLIPGSTTATYANQIFGSFLTQLKSSVNPPKTLAAFLQDWDNFLTPTAVLTNAAATGALSGLPTYQAYYDAQFGTDVGFTSFVTQFINSQIQTNGSYFSPSQSYAGFQTAVKGYTSTLQSLISSTYENFNGLLNAPNAAILNLAQGIRSYLSLNITASPANFFGIDWSAYPPNSNLVNPAIDTAFLSTFSSLLGLNIPAESSLLTSTPTGSTTVAQVMDQAFKGFLESIQNSVPTTTTSFVQDWYQFIMPTAVLSTAASTATGLPSYQAAYDTAFGTDIGFSAFMTNFISTETTANGYFLPSQFYTAFQTSVQSYDGVLPLAIITQSVFQDGVNNGTVTIPSGKTANQELDYIVNTFTTTGGWNQLLTALSTASPTQIPSGQVAAYVFDNLLGSTINPTTTTQPLITSAVLTDFENILNLNTSQEVGFLGPLATGITNGTDNEYDNAYLDSIFTGFIKQLANGTIPAPTTLDSFISDWNNFIGPPTAVISTQAGTVSNLPSYQAFYDAAFGTDVGFTSYLTQFVNYNSPNGYFLPSPSYAAFQSAVEASTHESLLQITVQEAFDTFNAKSGVSITNPNTVLNNLLADVNFGLLNTSSSPAAFFDSLFNSILGGTSSYSNTAQDLAINNAFLANFSSKLNLSVTEESTLLTGGGTTANYMNQIFGAFLTTQSGNPQTLGAFVQDWNTFITPQAVVTIAAGTASGGLPSYEQYYDNVFQTAFGTDTGFTAYVTQFINSQIQTNGYFIPTLSFTAFQNSVLATTQESPLEVIPQLAFQAYVNSGTLGVNTGLNANSTLDAIISQIGNYYGTNEWNLVFNQIPVIKVPSTQVPSGQAMAYVFDWFFYNDPVKTSSSFIGSGPTVTTTGSPAATQPDITDAYLTNLENTLNITLTPPSTELGYLEPSATGVTALNTYFDTIVVAFVKYLAAPSTNPPTDLNSFNAAWNSFIGNPPTGGAVISKAASTASGGLPSYQAYYESVFGSDTGFTSLLNTFINTQMTANGYFIPSQNYSAFQTFAQTTNYQNIYNQYNANANLPAPFATFLSNFESSWSLQTGSPFSFSAAVSSFTAEVQARSTNEYQTFYNAPAAYPGATNAQYQAFLGNFITAVGKTPATFLYSAYYSQFQADVTSSVAYQPAYNTAGADPAQYQTFLNNFITAVGKTPSTFLYNNYLTQFTADATSSVAYQTLYINKYQALYNASGITVSYPTLLSNFISAIGLTPATFIYTDHVSQFTTYLDGINQFATYYNSIINTPALQGLYSIEPTQTFLSNFITASGQTPATFLYNSDDYAQFQADVTSMTNYYSFFFKLNPNTPVGTTPQAQYQSSLNAFMTSIGAFPSTFLYTPNYSQFQAFLTAPLIAQHSTQFTLATNKSAKITIALQLIELMIQFINTLQNSAVAQSKLLTFYTNWEESYTQEANNIPTFSETSPGPYTSGDTLGIQGANSTDQAYAQNLRDFRSIVDDNAKNIQSDINQSNQAVNQETNLITQILQEFATLLQNMFH